MTYEEYRAACTDVVYLSACAVNGQVPDEKRVGQMDLARLYKAADRHLLTGITAMALALPEHTVVPYPNVPRSEYPKNVPLKVYSK